MDKRTKNILNNVTRELFEANEDTVRVNNPNLPPETAEALNNQELTARMVNASRDVADHFKEAQGIRNQIAADKVSRAIGNVADDFRQARNEAISRGASPDVQMRDPQDEEAKEIVYNTFKDKLVRDRNPHGFMDYDPALGDANPWYVKAGQWVGANPGYAAMAAGAPLALAAGAYYLNKRRKGNK